MGRQLQRPANTRDSSLIRHREPNSRRSPLALVLGYALLCTLPCLPGCGDHQGLSAEDQRAIRSLLEQQRQAWNNGNLDGFMAAYEPTKELVFTSGGQIRRGWQTTHQHYRQRYGQDQATMGELDFEILEIQELGTDGAIVLGRWHLSATPEAGAGVFSLGLHRGPLGWRIIHDHTSVEAPGPKSSTTPTTDH